MEMEQGFTDIGGTVLASWSVVGESPPLVCLHGAGVSSREMLPLLSALHGKRAAWSVDLPGFGASEPVRAPIEIGVLADALVLFLDATFASAVYLMGCSSGCQVAVDLAVRCPEHVRGLVLVGPTVDAKARSFPRQLWRWVRNGVHEPRGLGALVRRDYRDAGPRRVAAAFRAALCDPIEDKLPKVQQPTLVVRGEYDRMVPKDWAEEVTRLLPQGRLRTWPGAAHMVPFADPSGLADALDEFVSEVQR
ncbi:alpha/beta hydrolase [Saccharopolyspora shandongensis]|uniref:alpha/beta fold hydrolase n=1 Tax=Saccharopolyspora shandongensis TaxID=418495 RepID=UPI0033F5652F